MTQAEFSTETLRLYRGSNCEGELTPERMAALWETYGHLPAETWHLTVTRLLRDPLRPTTPRIEAALQYAEEAEARRLQIAAREPARIGVAPVRRDGPPDEWRTYQRFRHALLDRTRDESLTPGRVADILETEADEEFHKRGYVLAWEITAYRRSPDDWNGVALPS